MEQHDHDGISEDREQRPPVYFNVLFYGLIIWGVIFSAYYLLSGWSSDAEFQEKMAAHEARYQQTGTTSDPGEKSQTTAAPAAATADGAALYAERCAMCHAADGGGGVGPALNVPEYIYGKDNEAVRISIANGRENGMPAFGSQLSQAELDALVSYVLSL